MKKMIALLLAVIMLLGLTGTALAYDEEITWQDIPWYGSIEETVSAMIESEIVNGIDDGYIVFDSGFEGYLLDESAAMVTGGFTQYDGAQNYTKGIMGWTEKKIAGYSIGEFCLCFFIDGEKEELVNVFITLKYPNTISEAIADLKSTIETVYGDCNIIYDRFLVAFGENDTVICLDLESKAPSINLVYGKKGNYELLKQMIENGSL